MGYKLLKFIEGAEYNTKVFIVDNGAVDLPPIRNRVDIMPGSEAWDIRNKDTWVLNTDFQWVKSTWRECGGGGGGGGIPDVPTTPTNTSYVRYVDNTGGTGWKVLDAVEDIPSSAQPGKYVREISSTGQTTWVKEEGSSMGFPEYTTAQWLALTDKPAIADISDSPFDFFDTNYIH